MAFTMGRAVASSGIQWNALMGQQEGYFVTGQLQHLTWLLPNPTPNPLWHNLNSEQTKAPKSSWMGIFAAVVFPGTTTGAVIPTPLWGKEQSPSATPSAQLAPPWGQSCLCPSRENTDSFYPTGTWKMLRIVSGRENFFRDFKQDFILFSPQGF